MSESSKTKRPTPGELAEALRSRLRDLLRAFSQSEIARRTGVPQSSLSRYLDGQRVPADLCVRLVMDLGVSPRWVLLGDGPVYASELAESESEHLSQLRQLLEALHTLSESGLETLGCKEHERDLLAIQRLLERHRELRARLRDEIRPLLESLLDQARQVLDGDSDHHAATPLLELCEELDQICEDPPLRAELSNLRAYVLNRDKRAEDAIAIRRRAFRDTFYSDEMEPADQLAREFNFVSSLRNAGYAAEAHRLARGLVEIHAHHDAIDSYWLLVALVGLCEIDDGQVSDGVQRLLHSLPRTPERFHRVQQAHITYGLVLQGAQTLSTAIAMEVDRVSELGDPERAMVGLMLLRLAVVVQCADSIETLHRECLDVIERRYPIADPLPQHSKTLLRVLRGESVTMDGADHADTLAQAESLVFATQLARICEWNDVEERLLESASCIEGLTGGRRMKLNVRWLHAVNTLSIIDPETRSKPRRRLLDQARGFLDDYVGAGYRMFGEGPTST